MPRGEWWMMVASQRDDLTGDVTDYFFGPKRDQAGAEALAYQARVALQSIFPNSHESSGWTFGTRRLRDLEFELRPLLAEAEVPDDGV